MSGQDHTLTWQAWALISAVFAALTAILAKVGVAGVAPDFATVVRTIVILIAATAIAGLTGAFTRAGDVSASTYLFLGLSGLATAASWIAYNRALSIGPASAVAPLEKISIVLVAVLGTLFLKEHLSWRNWLGVAFIATGAILVALRD
ncbi:EamA family transporter [Brevundimonas aveniformis]|uniref:EamA family transporter n=1 Tax=Brevundimonas aveniformis TaxID=370977 RepID=UPI0004246CD6|nr:EamA family transporter [Brevundimonas aveniformis]